MVEGVIEGSARRAGLGYIVEVAALHVHTQATLTQRDAGLQR